MFSSRRENIELTLRLCRMTSSTEKIKCEDECERSDICAHKRGPESRPVGGAEFLLGGPEEKIRADFMIISSPVFV